MIDQVTGGKRLPAAVRQEVVAKTDGVPLFVEELTKMVLESGLLREEADHYELRGSLPSLAIPTTLHDSLMARLDRLANAKEVAQLGATLGRTFSNELLRAVSPWDEERLQHALAQLVEAELLYQRGVPPEMTYAFKHALIQETAYQSLLKSKRQQYHSQTAQVLEELFPEVTTTQPELLAHHYTEAGLLAQALPYWQCAGQRAVERSANGEAVSHFTKGLELLQSLPAAPERAGQELALQLALGTSLRMVKGHTAPELESLYTRAYELSKQVGESRQQFSALVSLWRLSINRARILEACELAEQCVTLAQHWDDPGLLQEAYRMLGESSFFHGQPVVARTYLEQGVALYDAQQGHVRAFSSGMEPGVICLSFLAATLWQLGYPEQALTRSHEALTLAQKSSHAYSLGFALNYASLLHVWRREVQFAKERAETVITLSNEHGFIQASSAAMIKRGWALAKQGAVAEGIRQLHQGLATMREMGQELPLSLHLTLLAEAYRQEGQVDAGLHVLAEALTHLDKTWERVLEAEIYRLTGECLLAQTGKRCKEREAEERFRQALDVARHQQAKSFELRAAMSLGRLWQQQGKRAEARQMLAEIYGWFTEGFETLDLQEAEALLEALA
jgi:predicted ATPase